MSSEELFSLPLFPLQQVLFPCIPLQLHIFEDRYKVMMQRCIDNNEPFGVTLILEGEEIGATAIPHTVGCLARILAVKPLDDGRMHVLAMGEERFRLLSYREVSIAPALLAEPGYLVGQVSILQDEGVDDPNLPPLAEEALTLFARYMECLAEVANLPPPEISLPDTAAQLSFYIGAIVKMPLEAKQKILSLTDVRARLALECRLLREEIEELEAMRRRSHAAETDSLNMDRPEFWRDHFYRGRN